MKSWRMRAVIRILMLVALILAEDEEIKQQLRKLTIHLGYSEGAQGEKELSC